MLVLLPHGVCVDPEIVKFFHIRTERPKGPGKPIMHTVVMKTDEEGFLVVAATDDREEAVKLSQTCAKLINKALGVEDEEEEKPKATQPAPSAAASAAPAKAPAANEDDDWGDEDDDDW